MKAAILHAPAGVGTNPIRIADVARPKAAPGQVLLRVRACGVCRTDLHIVEGELAPLRSPLIPGHQIVGEISRSVKFADPLFAISLNCQSI